MLIIFLFCRVTVRDLPPTPSKFHYIFNLRDLSRIYNGLCLTTPDRFEKVEQMLRVWRNECTRVIFDRLINENDKELVFVSTVLPRLYATLYNANLQLSPRFVFIWSQKHLRLSPTLCTYLLGHKSTFDYHQDYVLIYWVTKAPFDYHQDYVLIYCVTKAPSIITKIMYLFIGSQKHLRLSPRLCTYLLGHKSMTKIWDFSWMVVKCWLVSMCSFV